jgi:hypothetical protein
VEQSSILDCCRDCLLPAPGHHVNSRYLNQRRFDLFVRRIWLTGFIWSTKVIFNRGKSRDGVLNRPAFERGGISLGFVLHIYDVGWRRGVTP